MLARDGATSLGVSSAMLCRKSGQQQQQQKKTQDCNQRECSPFPRNNFYFPRDNEPHLQKGNFPRWKSRFRFGLRIPSATTPLSTIGNAPVPGCEGRTHKSAKRLPIGIRTSPNGLHKHKPQLLKICNFRRAD